MSERGRERERDGERHGKNFGLVVAAAECVRPREKLKVSYETNRLVLE